MAEMADPEQITIIEGPTPEFHVVMDPWTLSLLEGHIPYIIATCQVRSYNGEKLMERCLRAWDNHRVIKLDYRQIDGLRRQVDIVSARLEKIEEVDVLNLWVRQPVRKLINIVNDDSLKFGDDE
ncbi:MAG: hypothetical protein HZC40_23565 [Chloroflexi bacterium]|nr:hypothetical protein [Chloroflexota bacterium]